MESSQETTGILQGQVAIVTGAGRGFGRAIAERLVAEGALVCLTQRSQDHLAEVGAGLVSDRVIAVAGDVAQLEDVRRVVRETQARLGPVSLLVNNAGVHGPLGPLWEVDPDAWWQTQEVHLRGALLYCNAVLPTMVEQKAGRVITIASSVGLRPSTNFSAYAVAKASQIRLMESVAAETGDYGISAFALQPGTALTDLNQSIMTSPDAERWMPNLVKHLERIAQESNASEVLSKCAGVCVELASGRYDVLTGRYLDVAWNLEALAREVVAERGDSSVGTP